MACTVEAPVVQTSSTITARAPFRESLQCAVHPVLLFRLAYEKALQFAADHSDRYHDGIGAHGQSADGLRFHPRCRISSKNT